jgi:hypothetical protein
VRNGSARQWARQQRDGGGAAKAQTQRGHTRRGPAPSPFQLILKVTNKPVRLCCEAWPGHGMGSGSKTGQLSQEVAELVRAGTFTILQVLSAHQSDPDRCAGLPAFPGEPVQPGPAAGEVQRARLSRHKKENVFNPRPLHLRSQLYASILAQRHRVETHAFHLLLLALWTDA